MVETVPLNNTRISAYYCTLYIRCSRISWNSILQGIFRYFQRYFKLFYVISYHSPTLFSQDSKVGKIMNKILNKLTVTDLNLSESGGVGSLQFRKGFQSGMEDQVSSIVENNRIKSHLK